MKLRKIASLFAAVSMCFSLAACGGVTDDSSPSGSGGEGSVSLPKNIEVQLPASAGGGTDVTARALTAYINQNGSSNMTVVNNNDGGGVVAFETVRNAKADGSTILFFHTTMSIKAATACTTRAPPATSRSLAAASQRIRVDTCWWSPPTAASPTWTASSPRPRMQAAP